MRAAIGGFDGMHIGHQAIISRSDIVVVIEKGSNLTPGKDRCEYTDLPCVFFDLKEIKDLSPSSFISLLKDMNITKTVIGEDFRFGKNRSGDAELLKKHFEVETVPEVKINGIGVHSRVIREYIKNGKIKQANTFLGHTYKIKGRQIKGQGLGSKELVPTINLQLIKSYIIPKSGVYITKTASLPSVTFVGVRSSDNVFSIETHILTNGFEIQEEIINVEFLVYLRENKKFNDLKELKKQIKEDLKKASDYFPMRALN